ncbi:MAG: type II toxin-antitoxin system VapC family toxin [Acidimicrobiales bacterium]
MIVYFDTSAILPIVIEEPSSQVASRLWDEADRVVSSRLVYAEARAALAMAHRMNRVDGQGLRSAVEEFEALQRQLDIIEVTEELIRGAGQLAEQLGLRGYDAVHLASAQTVADADLVLAAGDQNLLDAARALEMATADTSGGS